MPYHYNPKSLGFDRMPPPPPPVDAVVGGLDETEIREEHRAMKIGVMAGGMPKPRSWGGTDPSEKTTAPKSPWQAPTTQNPPVGPIGVLPGEEPEAIERPPERPSFDSIKPPASPILRSQDPAKTPERPSFDSWMRDTEKPSKTPDKTPRARTADEILNGNPSRVAKMPAPEGYRYAVNPTTNAIELVDITPLDKSRPIEGWKWITDDPSKPNAGRWVFMPTDNVLDKPFEGVPQSVIPWYKRALDAGGNANVVPEGPAREWVKFLLQREAGGMRGPEEMPFGEGIPERTGAPAIPTIGPSEAGTKLMQVIQAGEGSKKVYAALKKFVKEVGGSGKGMPMPVSIDTELMELGFTEEQIQDLLALWAISNED